MEENTLHLDWAEMQLPARPVYAPGTLSAHQMGIETDFDAPDAHFAKPAPRPAPKPPVVEEFTQMMNDWFDEGDRLLAQQKPVETPPKKGWFAALGEKVSRGFEKLGTVLDYATPTVLAGVAATVFAATGTHLKELNAPDAPAPEPIVMNAHVPMPEIVLTKSTIEFKAPARTLAETTDSPEELNKLLIEKNEEIVAAAEGKSTYLFSAKSFAHFKKQLHNYTGFEEILNHPEVQKAENIAQLINLTDQYFGEDWADLVESNAAAMHLSVSSIEKLR